ncbi:MAG: tRNA-dependent cyclodipeptide synthase [Candidatus Paceibacterota bacterium]
MSISNNDVTIRGNKGVDLSEVKDKKHNIWIGVSVSNKMFNRENIKSLILFCLENTKYKVLVWIPGRMQATNYRYFERMSRADALRKGFEQEDVYKKMVQDILSELPSRDSDRVVLANYDDICTPKHIRQREIFYREFSLKGTFYNEVMSIIEEVIIARGRQVNKDNKESLALYILQELPLFCDGVQKNGEETIYTVVPYPGFGKLDELEMDIIEGKKFPDLTIKLNLENKVGILDVIFG